MSLELLRKRAHAMQLWGLLAHWAEVGHEDWVVKLVEWEEEEHRRRSLEYRSGKAKLGAFKPLADFDWTWPRRVDRELVEELAELGFVKEKANVVLVGPNGVGKTMLAQNLAHEALLRGHKVIFTTASAMLGDLAACEGAASLERALRRYVRPQVLVVDEVGYLSYGPRHADLLFEVISRRCGKHPTILTTNRPFAEWNDVFPNAASVVALVDRLMHKAELVRIDGDSYRAKESAEREKARRKKKPTDQ
jgi:DNA replication protein DnaC